MRQAIYVGMCGFAFLGSVAAGARRFAIACDGTGAAADTVTGRIIRHQSKLKTNVYVIDDVAKTVDHALEPRQEFEPVCEVSNGGDRLVDISQGLIRATSGGDLSTTTSTTCSFEVNRRTGTAKFELKIEFSKTQYNLNVWQMQCRPTSIPTFPVEHNEF